MARFNRFDTADLTKADLLPSQSEMAHFDSVTITGGIPAEVLMERAGFGVVQELKQLINFPGFRRAAILCGPGHNGGDGLVIARLLRDCGLEVEVALAQADKYSAGLTAAAVRFTESGWPVRTLTQNARSSREPLPFPAKSIAPEELLRVLNSADLVVDALLGTGQKEAPRGGVLELLNIFKGLPENREQFIAAVDIPTGINADSGEVFQPHIRADLTVAIELIKRGLLQYPARSACGRIRIAPVGIHYRGECEFAALSPRRLPPWIRRAPAAHKGELGRVLVIGGSAAMPGAPLLAATAALRAGAGLVTVARPKSVAAGGALELLYRWCDDQGTGVFQKNHVQDLLNDANAMDALVVGPGLGSGSPVSEFLTHLLPNLKLPAVIDADALNFLAVNRGLLPALAPFSGILTPHPGEAARLLDTNTAAIQKDRYRSAGLLAALIPGTVVLKGSGTIIAGPGRGLVDPAANPFLATAGSGDVLSGIAGAFLARGLPAFEAAAWAVLIHSRAGLIATAGRTRPIIASDLLSAIPAAMEEFERLPLETE